jgi:hypothetical protein
MKTKRTIAKSKNVIKKQQEKNLKLMGATNIRYSGRKQCFFVFMKNVKEDKEFLTKLDYKHETP